MVSQFREMGSEFRKNIPQADRAKAPGYAARLTSLHFILYIAHYQDLLENMADLSLAMQNENVALSSVRSEVEVATASLLAMKSAPGPHLQKVLQETQGDDITFKGHVITKDQRKFDAYRRKSKEVVDEVVKCITSRFKGFTTDSVLQAADILDPANYPSGEEIWQPMVCNISEYL